MGAQAPVCRPGAAEPIEAAGAAADDIASRVSTGMSTKRARFRRRFEARGIAPAVLARLTCPIGVPGIEGKEPEVIAVAVVAQLLLAAGTAPR